MPAPIQCAELFSLSPAVSERHSSLATLALSKHKQTVDGASLRAADGRHASKGQLMALAKFDGIQLLRAVAAMMVVTHHATHSVPGAYWLPFGGAGVDIFFVISGFVMSHTTRNKPVGSATAQDFALRRIIRIVPLYWLALAWTTRRDAPDLNLLRDFFFVPHYNADYPSMINPILIQGWTLNYEMLFYALFAFCLCARKPVIVLVFLLVLVVTSASLLPSVYGRFYSNDIVLEFAFGLVLYKLPQPKWHRFVWLSILVAGFILLALGFSQEPRAVWQGLPAVVVVWASLGACKGWLKVPGLALVANASYAIYLFHWAAFGAVKPLSAFLGSAWVSTLMLAHILTALAAGVLIHLLVEKPMTGALQARYAARRTIRASIPPRLEAF